MADAKLTALTAASALAGADLFYISQGGVSKKATHTQLLTLVGTTYVPLAGGTMTGALTIGYGGHTLGLSISGSNILITPSTRLVVGSSSYDTSVGSLWTVMAASGALQSNIRSYPISFGTDVLLLGDAAATLAQRNGTTQQIFRLYNTYTDASNYERLTLTGVAGSSVNITAETLGTGGDNLDIVLTPAGTGGVNLGSLVKIPNNGAVRNSDSGGTHRLYLDVSNVVFRRGDGASAPGMWKFGGETSSFAGMKASGTTMLIRLADDSADAPLSALYVKTASTTVAGLTAAATAGAGARAFVTDANATTDRSVVAGGGANKVPVFSDGTNWLIG